VQSANAELSGGIAPRREPQTLGRDGLLKQFGSLDAAGVAAVAFMRGVWAESVYREFVARYPIPARTVRAGEQHADELHEKEAVGECEVIETGGGIGGGIDRVVATLVGRVQAGKLHLYQQGGTALCRVVQAAGASVNVVPVQNSATLRTIIAQHVKLRVKDKNGKVFYEDIRFTGRGRSAEFDPGMLKDLFERALPEALPELTGVVHMPIMPSLPSTGQVSDIRRNEGAAIVAAGGHHGPTKLYLD
jgi:hypothetical protein